MKKFKRGLVSIITPVFNGETFLLTYLKSIYNQTYSELELILIDDGSTDQTFSIAKNYQKNFAKFN